MILVTLWSWRVAYEPSKRLCGMPDQRPHWYITLIEEYNTVVINM
ncbi:MAG: hypothetical protein PF590_02720 [Candidatus Delongbacteria bacterium]|nr:hypothetical protein [Candidatus Delongbacteria bacterium]